MIWSFVARLLFPRSIPVQFAPIASAAQIMVLGGIVGTDPVRPARYNPAPALYATVAVAFRHLFVDPLRKQKSPDESHPHGQLPFRDFGMASCLLDDGTQ